MAQNAVSHAQRRREFDPMNPDNDVLEARAESPANEIIKIECEGDPEVLLAVLEKKAELAPRFRAALDAILASQTFPEDWKEFDGTMCLKSAGAERVGKNFPIQFFDVTWKREEWTDGIGKAYRFIYEGKAALGGHIVYATGSYGTRDAFLGKANGEWRALEEINPATLQNAAYHMFCGNAIKALLGLRGIARTQWEAIMNKTGQDPKGAGKTPHTRGSQGGTSADDAPKQKELAEICIAIANAGYLVVSSDYKNFTLEPTSEIADAMEVARSSCVTLSTFIGKGDKKVPGLGAKQLKGKRLEMTLDKAREMAKKLEQQS